jgi:hypothetical protein
MLQSGRMQAQILMGVNGFFSIYLILSCTMVPVLAQLLTEMSTRNLPGGGGVKRGQYIRLTSPPSMSRLFGKRGTFNVP